MCVWGGVQGSRLDRRGHTWSAFCTVPSNCPIFSSRSGVAIPTSGLPGTQ